MLKQFIPIAAGFFILTMGFWTFGQAAEDATTHAVAQATQPMRMASTHQRPDWRYCYHNGTWWYWLPSNRWVCWSGGTWVDYVPRTRVYSYPYHPSYGYGYGGHSPRYSSGYRGRHGHHHEHVARHGHSNATSHWHGSRR